ncbi:DinB family protein [soil metagenome]
MTVRSADDPDAYPLPFGEQIHLFVDEHRHSLDASLDGLSEEQARRRLVASGTTLLGLVRHATFVERVWFEEAFTGLSRSVLGIEEGPDESFHLEDDDTIESVRAAYRAACRRSRDAVVGRTLDDVVTGNRRGALPLRWVLLHLLRELAQHCGHADILREQVLASPNPS